VRTTLTLEDDVANLLRAEMRQSGKGMKEIVNEYLRLALNAKRGVEAPKRFRVRPWAMGSTPGLNRDNIGELLEQLEGPTHR
jgi:hypothetical protein